MSYLVVALFVFFSNFDYVVFNYAPGAVFTFSRASKQARESFRYPSRLVITFLGGSIHKLW